MRLEEKRHLLIGLCMTLGLIGLVFFSGQFSANKGGNQNSYQLLAQFLRLDGIAAGSPVMLAGIDVGTVQSVRLSPETERPEAVLQIDKAIDIPYDSSIKIISAGLFGGKYLSIIPGGDFEVLEDGDHFEFTQPAIVLDNLLTLVLERAEAARQSPNSQ